ncbi:MAG: monovalent cation/H+ antiporter subunit D family protein [Pseudomonadales bacterium]|nr:monovalent cation/H+ antiporter subunit D family protein [Pseudomonadales bacterium]
MDNLAVIQVLLPLLSAPLCLLFNKARLAWMIAVVVSWAALFVSLSLLVMVNDNGPIIYEQGGWPAPIGIVYHVDILTAFVLLIVTSIAAVVMPYAGKSVEKEIPVSKQPAFFSALLLCMAGLLGIVSTGDAFNVFVFLEISSLATYALLSQGKDRRSLTSTFQYLIMGTIGGTFILIGIGLIYMKTGTLNMADLADRLPAVFDSRTVHASFAFLTVGICLKLALFPLHLWLPNAYTYAPSVVTIFVAATSTKVAVYMLLRFSFTVFGVDLVFAKLPLTEVLLPLAIVGILVGSLAAIKQSNIKRMLAYSSVAQIGYMILGISFVSASGLTGGILHLFNHAIIKAALFMALGAVAYQIGSTHIDALKGLAKKMPWTFAGFAIGGLSIIGVPLTAGFVSKWYLVLAAIEKEWWIVVAVLLVGSLLAVIYIWRVVEVAYFQTADDESDIQVKEAPLQLLIPLWILVIANIYFGINTSLTVESASSAATMLLGANS